MNKIGNIPIVYEDNWLLVVDKPAGLLTIPTPKKESRTLTSILHAHPCHRLDRETSGLIIYAKGKSTQKKMMQEFKDKRVKKKYIGVPWQDITDFRNVVIHKYHTLDIDIIWDIIEHKLDPLKKQVQHILKKEK